MSTIVEGRNSADTYSPLDGGAGILLPGLEAAVWAGVSTDIFVLFLAFFELFLQALRAPPLPFLFVTSLFQPVVFYLFYLFYLSSYYLLF